MAGKTIGGTNIYGQLNNQVTAVEYYGKNTDTADINIDNTERTIQIDVKKVPNKLIINDHEAAFDKNAVYVQYEYDGSKELEIFLRNYLIKEVEPEKDNTSKEYALFRDGIELPDRIYLPRDQALIKATLIYINNDNIEDVKVQCPEAKENDPCLDLVVSNQIDGNKEKHYFILLASFVDKLHQEIVDESKRTDNMINQLNNNVHDQFVKLNKILVDAINTINGGIQEEREIREAADKKLQENLDIETARTNNMINQVNSNIITITNQINQNMADGFNTINGGIQTFKEETATNFANEKEARENADNEIHNRIDTEVDTLNKAINTEKERAEAAEKVLTDNLNAEINRAKAAESQLQINIDDVNADLQNKWEQATEAVTTEVNRLDDRIDQEIQDRENAITTLSIDLNNKLNTETQNRISADNALSQRVENLEGKTTRLYYGEGTLTSPTATEIQDFIDNLEVDPPYTAPYGGIAIVVKLTDENTYHIWHYYSNLNTWKDDGVDLVTTFTNDFKGIIQGTTSAGYISADNGFGKVNGWEDLNSTVSSNYNTLDKKINDSVSTLNNTISSLSTRLDTKIDTLDDKVDEEIANRTEAINNLDTELTADINAEKTAREQADTTLTNNLNQEIQDRKTAVSDEASARQSADNTLTTNLNKEISDRKTADTNLTNTELRFTKSTGTTVAVGGIAKGTTFSNKKLMDIINDMLYPYVPFSISGFTLSPNNGGTFENGSTVTLSNSTTTVNLGSENITRVTIYDGQNKLGEKTSGFTGNSFQVPITLSITANKTLKTEVADAKGTVLSRNSSAFTFVYPFYYGSLANGVYDEASVKGLTKVVQSKGSKTFRFTHTDKCCVIAYPSSYGNLKTVIDQNNFDVTSSFTQHTVSITGLNGTPVSYYVYTNSPATLDNFGLTFNF